MSKVHLLINAVQMTVTLQLKVQQGCQQRQLEAERLTYTCGSAGSYPGSERLPTMPTLQTVKHFAHLGSWTHKTC